MNGIYTFFLFNTALWKSLNLLTYIFFQGIIENFSQVLLLDFFLFTIKIKVILLLNEFKIKYWNGFYIQDVWKRFGEKSFMLMCHQVSFLPISIFHLWIRWILFLLEFNFFQLFLRYLFLIFKLFNFFLIFYFREKQTTNAVKKYHLKNLNSNF